MTTKKESLDRQRTEVAKRLREILKEKKMKQATLRRETFTRFDRKITAAQLSQIVNGTRTLQPDFCRIFSEILGIEPGYLMGTDDFHAQDYRDFINRYGSEAQSQHERENAERTKYDRILGLIGFEVYDQFKDMSENINDLGEPEVRIDSYYCVVGSKGQCAYIPEAKLDRLVKVITLLEKEMIRPLMQLHRVEPPEWMY